MVLHQGLSKLTLALLLLAGCKSDETEFGFRLEGMDVRPGTNSLNVEIHQALVLSREARNALEHGVALSIQTELTLRAVGSRRDLDHLSKGFQIRYLPLSDHYQLTSSDPLRVSTYPRLRHVLAELSTVRFELPARQVSAGALELQARTWLDRRDMPSPMHLPALFSTQWQLDTGWRTWPLTAATGT